MKKYKKRRWTVAEKLEAVQARKNGLRLEDVRNMYGVCTQTLYQWTDAYEKNGIAGLEQSGSKRGQRDLSSKVESAEKILDEVMPSEPNAGIGKVQGALYRKGFLSLARETVRRLLHRKTNLPFTRIKPRRNKPKQIRHFERANPNDLWQTDIMTFMLKGQYRVHLIGFMDDNSRFLVGWGLYRFQTTANVQEVFRAAIEKHGMPKEVLSDNGRQYYTWRGKSKFTEMLTKLGIRHIRSRPYHPQTLGKIESFWRNLFQECLSQLPVSTFEEAKEKIGEYIEYYNFKRPHQGIGNLMPSDRFYRVGDQVKQIIEQNSARVEESKPPLSDYRPPAYIVGSFGGQELRVIAKDAEVSLISPEKNVLKDESVLSVPPIVESKGSEEGVSTDGNSGQPKEIAQPAGADGSDSPRAGQGAVDRELVRASGSVEGALLPMDEAGQRSRDESSGGESAGTQNDLRESGNRDQEASKAIKEVGEEKQEAFEGTGPIGSGVSSGAENHPTAGMGTCG